MRVARHVTWCQSLDIRLKEATWASRTLGHFIVSTQFRITVFMPTRWIKCNHLAIRGWYKLVLLMLCLFRFCMHIFDFPRNYDQTDYFYQKCVLLILIHIQLLISQKWCLAIIRNTTYNTTGTTVRLGNICVWYILEALEQGTFLIVNGSSCKILCQSKCILLYGS